MECEGYIRINDKTVAATSVTLRTVENYVLLVRDNSVFPRYELFIKFFPVKLLSNPPERTDGTVLEFQEPNTSNWSYGPLGHPGDGEFEVRRLKSLAMTVTYSSGAAVIFLRGATESGVSLYKGIPDQSQTALLPPWNFSVSFLLSEASAKALYVEEISDSKR